MKNIFNMGCVYAGPEQMGKNDLRKSLKKYPVDMNDSGVETDGGESELQDVINESGETASVCHDAEIMLLYAAPEILDEKWFGAEPVKEPVQPVKSRRFCPECGASNGCDSKFCNECGAKLPVEGINV